MEPDHIKETRLRLGAAKTAEIQAVCEGLAETLRPVLAGIMSRLDQLEQLQKETRYRGIWAAQETYKVGNSATDKGNVFICKLDNQGQRPGTSEHWQLAVRRGQDGKDAAR